jgi:hypothetical protein
MDREQEAAMPIHTRRLLAALLMASTLASAPAIAVAQKAAASGGQVLVHPETGFEFPAERMGFVRQNAELPQGADQYVPIRYRKTLPDKAIVKVGVTITHIDMMTAKDHYTIRKQDLLNKYKVIRTVEEGPMTPTGFPTVKGEHGIFLVTDASGAAPHKRGLWTFVVNGWNVRLVADYPNVRTGPVPASIRAFLYSFDWAKLMKTKPA